MTLLQSALNAFTQGCAFGLGVVSTLVGGGLLATILIRSFLR